MKEPIVTERTVAVVRDVTAENGGQMELPDSLVNFAFKYHRQSCYVSQLFMTITSISVLASAPTYISVMAAIIEILTAMFLLFCNLVLLIDYGGSRLILLGIIFIFVTFILHSAILAWFAVKGF